MTSYVSTRGEWARDPQPFCGILLEGLAPDGGLAVPEAYPRLQPGALVAMSDMGYRDLAFAVLARFISDIPHVELRALIDRTYTAATFGSEAITPVTGLEAGVHLLHVSNGPTLAFKDIALQLLGHLFEYVLARKHRELNVVGATSGDTGSSAEYAMRGKRGIRVFMLSPHGRMSPFQTAQMFSLADPNVHNLAIDGVFDECQDIVKAISGDASFKRRFAIGTVNSINWARVAAQVVYYFKGYFAVAPSVGAPVDFAVPTGNFGNILAGHVAKEMGLPIGRLILATNENDVLDEFFRTGRYRPRTSAETHATSSPSMDISKASNFERYVFDVVGRDPEVVRDLWHQLGARGWIRSFPNAALDECRGVWFRVGNEHPRRSRRDDPRDVRAHRRRRRPAHRGCAEGRSRPCGPGGAARLHRNGAAGEVRRHDSRGARSRPGPARDLCRS